MLCHRTGTVDVHVSTVSPAQPSHSEAQVNPGGGGDTSSPQVAVTTVVSTLATTLYGPPSILSVPSRHTVTTGVCLERQVGPSARMEALMQHNQTAGFGETQRSLGSPQLLEDPPQIECTMTGGYASLTGHRARI